MPYLVKLQTNSLNLKDSTDLLPKFYYLNYIDCVSLIGHFFVRRNKWTRKTKSKLY